MILNSVIGDLFLIIIVYTQGFSTDKTCSVNQSECVLGRFQDCFVKPSKSNLSYILEHCSISTCVCVYIFFSF